jgi:carboxymethylenebutenolidase
MTEPDPSVAGSADEALAAVTVEQTVLAGVGGAVPATIYRPAGPGPHPAIALGAEATGVNDFLRRVATLLAAKGFVCALPDYFRGGGPADPDGYDDLDDILTHLAALDFSRAARDVSLAVDALVADPSVDRERIGVWGYCTGATLALLASATRSDVAASVLFYPSQPSFEELDAHHPVSPFDLLWALRGSTLFLYGTSDVVLPPDVEADLRRRITAWDIDATLVMFEGAGHAFCSPDSSYYHPASAAAGWQEAVDFVCRRLRPGSR